MAVVVAATRIGSQRDMIVLPIGLVLAVAVAVAVVVAGHAPPWRGRLAQVGTLLGDASYGMYLLHPIVWRGLTFAHVSGRRAAVLTFVVTPILALLVHRLIEAPAGRTIRSTFAPRRRPARIVPVSPPSGLL